MKAWDLNALPPRAREQAAAQLGIEHQNSKRRNKYGARPVAVDGSRFDSGREYRYLKEVLEPRLRAGEIIDLVRQPKFPIVVDGRPVRAVRQKNGNQGRPLVVILDYQWIDVADARKRYIDVKGHDTDMSRLKRALVEHIYGIEVELV